MKKLLLVLALLICGVTIAANQTQKSKSRLEINIIDILTPACPDQMRSLLPCAEAWGDYETQSIEIEIYCAAGVVDIVIIDMYGKAVAGATIDTDATPYITLPMPVRGMYRLSISGPEYRGEGEFLIEE